MKPNGLDKACAMLLTLALCLISNVSLCDPLAIMTPSPLSQGTVGQTYLMQLRASGGVSPYTWSIASGSLPPGMSLSSSGMLNGTPTAVGTSNFNPRVTDQNGQWADRALSMNVMSATVLDPSVILSWQLNEGSGYTAYDTSRSRRDGMIFGGASWVVGKEGGALNLDGVSGSISASAVSLTGNAPHTVSAWIKVNALPVDQVSILLIGNYGPTSNPAQPHRWLLTHSGSAYVGTPNSPLVLPSMPVGQWTHIALTFDGTTLFGYVDGVLIGSQPATFNLQGTSFTVGWDGYESKYFNGVVDNIAIYQRALSATEVAELAGTTPNTPPTVSLTSPISGASITAPASITLSANASDSDGSIAKVEFYNGTTLINTDTTAPYSYDWTGVAADSYTLTAKATDNQGAATTSAPVNITVTPAANVAPTVSMTGPADGSSYTAPANITLTANAADSDGAITAVEFYNGATLIGSVTTPPYTTTWSNVPLGNYSVRARAVDNQGGATYSNTISINVTGAPPPSANVYYLYADHLNTPRVITDTSNKVVWRWDSDPFGADAANEDPDGDGTKFRYNPRFPGQYFDRETGLHYNYYRSSYDPGTGRYGEFDPIGLAGGLNGYAYANSNPLTFTDPLGLASIQETLTQIGAVGALDAHTASQIANESLAAARNSGLPGSHNGQADAYRHCLWSCEMAKKIGIQQAEKVGNIHEKLGGNPAGETSMDLRNNSQGRDVLKGLYCEVDGPDCPASCRGLLTRGKLQTSPGGTPSGKLY